MRSFSLRHCAFAAVLVLALGSSGAAKAQVLVPGERVRLVATEFGDEPQVGTVTAMRGDSITFRRESDSQIHTFGLNHLSRLDASGGRHSHPVRGLAIGLAVGGVAGAAAGASSTKDAFFGPGAGAAVGGAAGAVGGALVGLITGALIRTERWNRVPLDQPRLGVSLIPSPLGHALAVRVALRL